MLLIFFLNFELAKGGLGPLVAPFRHLLGIGFERAQTHSAVI